MKRNLKSWELITLIFVFGFLVALVFWFITKPASAIYLPPVIDDKICREILAPNPEQFEANIAKTGTVNATYKWFEDPEGTWTLKIDIDPQGGENHRNWQSTYPQNWGLLFKKPVALPQIIVEKSCAPTPTPTPEPGTPPTFAEKEGTPVCSDLSTSKLVANFHVIRNGSSATANFFLTEGNHANLFYKVNGSATWQYAVSNLQPNSDKFVSYTVNDLDPNLGYTFGAQQTVGCGTGEIATSVVVDPPANGKVFKFSYWIW